jgi:Tol biopolymer transport system component
MRSISVTALALCFLPACSGDATARRVNESVPPVIPAKPVDIAAGRPVESDPREVRLKNLRQLTFGAENAEAYWSFGGTKLIWQSTRPPYGVDQIWMMDLLDGTEHLVSTGKGRTTCAYFLKGDHRVLYASTHVAGDAPPPAVRLGHRYVWSVFPSYDLFTADLDGSNLMRLTDTDGYDAEATVCPVTGRIVFTSTRDGDLELYSMEADGSDVKRLTNRLGYDGGAFFSHDGSKIVLRSGFLKTPEEEREYRDLLGQNLVAPSKMEITVCGRDGGALRQVTDNGKANFAPFWCLDNRRILFASNMNDPRGRDFDLFLIDEDGTKLEQVTFNPTFDAFPMFSPDGKYVVFASNRFGTAPGETNVFVAEWVD